MSENPTNVVEPAELIEVHVPGEDQAEGARLLLDAAEELGHDPAVVQTIGGGFLVPRDVAERAGALDAEVSYSGEEDGEQVVGEPTPFQGGPDTPTLQGVPGEPLGEGEQLEVDRQEAEQAQAEELGQAIAEHDQKLAEQQDQPVELRGEALDQALRDLGLPTTGTADEKRARVAEHTSQQQ